MRRTITWLILGIAALTSVARVVAQTAPDPLTVYCNKKRGSLEAGMVKKQCKCSLKRVLNPSYDVNACLNAVPAGVVPKFVDKLAVIYAHVRAVFFSYPSPACQDESGFSSASLSAAGVTVVACCQSLSQYLGCVQQGAF